MIKKVISFFEWTRPWREQFGQLSGLLIALSLRRAMWSARRGATVTLRVPTIPNPIRIRAGSSDAAVFFQVFGDRQADFPVFGTPSVIVDAGANIGLTAVVFATRFPSARVLALEIDRENFALLKANTQKCSNVEPLNKGLWSKKTRIQVVNPQASSWAFRTMESQGGDAGSSIEAMGVADILSAFNLPRIDVLKIDIEGGEYEVFAHGVDDWIDRVGMIAVEVHDRIRPGCTEVIRQALKPHGFEESPWAEYLVFQRKPSTAG